MMKTITILAIVAAFMIGTTMSFFVADYDAEAKPAKKAKPVFVDGIGLVQTFTCPDLSQVGVLADPPRFVFNKGQSVPLSSLTTILASSSNARVVFGWGNAEISESDFKLIGTVIATGPEFCPTPVTLPSKAIMTGTCGLGQTATITTEQGFVITLNTDVVCG